MLVQFRISTKLLQFDFASWWDIPSSIKVVSPLERRLFYLLIRNPLEKLVASPWILPSFKDGVQLKSKVDNREPHTKDDNR